MPVALAIVILLSGALAVRLYRQYGTPEFTPTVVSLSNVSDISVTVRFIVGKPEADPAICTLDALAVDGSIVGTAEVPVPAGKSVTRVFALPTTSRAYVAEIRSCRKA